MVPLATSGDSRRLATRKTQSARPVRNSKFPVCYEALEFLSLAVEKDKIGEDWIGPKSGKLSTATCKGRSPEPRAVQLTHNLRCTESITVF